MERRTDAPAAEGPGIPRDLPDQQADAESAAPDPWDPQDADPYEEEDPDGEQLPDTDQSGTGRRGKAQRQGTHAEGTAPDEPTD